MLPQVYTCQMHDCWKSHVVGQMFYSSTSEEQQDKIFQGMLRKQVFLHRNLFV